MKNPNVINIDKTNKIDIAKLRANYGNLSTGYCEEAADALRAKILNAPNTEEIYEIKGTKYYVSVNGNDINDGKSPESAIKTLDAIKMLNLNHGDAVLFKRGDIFRFADDYCMVDGVTYGSYGEGKKPAFYGSPENYAENHQWQEIKPNIWKLSFPYPEVGGLVLDYGMVVGVQKKAQMLEGLTAIGDYCHDLENKIFYMYSEGKPSDNYHDIEIMPNITLFRLVESKDVTIDNFCIKYTAGFAIHAPDTQGNINITNCEIGYIGGLWMGNSVRYGNAIEFWAGCKNSKIENCWFYQTYDTALTWQGDSGKFGQVGIEYIDITYRENLFEYNNADIEFFGGLNIPVENFRMENNIMRFTSMGWGTRTNDGGIRGIEGCIRAVTGGRENQICDLRSAYFTNNLMDCPARQIINWNIEPEQIKNIHTQGSRIYINSKYRTLISCLQGLQTEKGQPYDRRFADDKDELIKLFSIFEDDAKIFWDIK